MQDAMWTPLKCAALRAQQQQPDPDLIDLANRHAVARSLDVALRHKGRFEVVDDLPGYLRKSFGSRSYYVPYGLAPVFPDDAALAQVDALAVAVRLATTGSICLSGSATCLGHITAITDLDFCEYFFESLAEARAQIDTLAKRAALPRLFRVKAAGQERLVPFSDLESLVDGMEPAPGATEFAQAKFDFVANTALFGAIAVTNLVLSTDLRAAVSPNASRSFPFQEIVIREGEERPHRNLVDPIEIGVYLNWLREESRTLVTAGSASLPVSGPKVVKGLKRALSWYLVIGETDAVARIVGLLSRPGVTAISRAARAAELARLLAPLDDEERGALETAAGVAAVDAGLSHDELVAVYEDVAAIAHTLLEEMDMLQSSIAESDP